MWKCSPEATLISSTSLQVHSHSDWTAASGRHLLKEVFLSWFSTSLVRTFLLFLTTELISCRHDLPASRKTHKTQLSLRSQEKSKKQTLTNTHKSCPFGFTQTIGNSRSLHDFSFSEWWTDPPLSTTKENTCLKLPNPSQRPCSLGSQGPRLIRTRAPGQGQDRLDPHNPSIHPCTHTSESAPYNECLNRPLNPRTRRSPPPCTQPPSPSAQT